MSEKKKYGAFLLLWFLMILAVCLISNSLEASGMILLVMSPFILMIKVFGIYIFKDDLAKCKNSCLLRFCPHRVAPNNDSTSGNTQNRDLAAGSDDHLVESPDGPDVVSVAA